MLKDLSVLLSFLQVSSLPSVKLTEVYPEEPPTKNGSDGGDMPYIPGDINLHGSDPNSAHYSDSSNQQGQPTLYVCEICNKVCASPSSLQKHKLTHLDPRCLTCPVCSKSFLCHWSLARHVRIHSGHRPFVCKVCGKGFMQSSDLRNHERIHSGDRPYMCRVCFRRFTHSSNWRKHERLHNDSNR